MDDLKLRIKIGENEFEAEGPADIVERHLNIFKNLIDNKDEPLSIKIPPSKQNVLFDKYNAIGLMGLKWPFREFFDTSLGRKVALLDGTAPGLLNETEAALLLLYALDFLEGGKMVRVTQLRSAMTLSGYVPDRIDRTLQPCIEKGWVSRAGKGKAARYRITEIGADEARAFIQNMKGRSDAT